MSRSSSSPMSSSRADSRLGMACCSSSMSQAIISSSWPPTASAGLSPQGPGVANARTSHVPSQPGNKSLWSCMNSTADATASQLEDSVAANDLLGLDERAVEDGELPVRYAHLRAHGHRHQPAIVEHAAR